MCTDSSEIGIISGGSEREREREVSGWGFGIKTMELSQIIAKEKEIPDDYAREVFSSEPDLLAYAKYLCAYSGWKMIQIGFTGYGDLPANAKVLIAVHNNQELEYVRTIERVLRDRGATVDLLVIDEGKDHELREGEEIDVIIRREPWTVKPRRWDSKIHVLNYAQENGYHLVIHGRGGRLPNQSPDGRYHYTFRQEGIPWETKEEFLSKSTVFPTKLHSLINRTAWNSIYKLGRGGKVRLTDPEGTDFEFSLFEKYFDRNNAKNFNPSPRFSHLDSHPTPPLLHEADTTGVIAGTTSHFGRPFPKIRVHVEQGLVTEIEGGGLYGELWRKLLDETRDVQYPGYPRKGLFWLWELAIGTNPKITRPSDILWARSGSFEYERRRSGIIHCGFGTYWQGEAEVWAGKKGIPYGHLHVHFLFPTYSIRTTSGETVKVIDNGRLTALDDGEVRDVARKYGDPDEVLKEDWIPQIPGISGSGSYDEYGNDPYTWMKNHPTSLSHHH